MCGFERGCLLHPSSLLEGNSRCPHFLLGNISSGVEFQNNIGPVPALGMVAVPHAIAGLHSYSHSSVVASSAEIEVMSAFSDLFGQEEWA